jgi:hypothetical protein
MFLAVLQPLNPSMNTMTQMPLIHSKMHSGYCILDHTLQFNNDVNRYKSCCVFCLSLLLVCLICGYDEADNIIHFISIAVHSTLQSHQPCNCLFRWMEW